MYEDVPDVVVKGAWAEAVLGEALCGGVVLADGRRVCLLVAEVSQEFPVNENKVAVLVKRDSLGVACRVR